MFERYTETARRTIFFARYEASQRSSGYIELEDLALGALREDAMLRAALPPHTYFPLSDRLRSIPPSYPRPTETSTDLPLSKVSKTALAYGAEEAERLRQQPITPAHLMAGVLRHSDSPAAMAIEAAGLSLERVRELARQAPPVGRPLARTALTTPGAIRANLSPITEFLFHSIATAIPRMYAWPQARFAERLEGDETWTRKQAVGHLVDLGTAHQHWIAAALAQGELHARNIPGKSWVEAQNYADMDSSEMLDSLICVNRHLLHVIARIPEGKLSVPCRIGEAKPVSLETVLWTYNRTLSEWINRITLKPKGGPA